MLLQKFAIKHSIAVVLPYFGKLPDYFPLFLISAKYNSNIDFLLFTNDRTIYNYPANFRVAYCEFTQIKRKIQRCFDFEISLEEPYKLCDYKPAYGLIFSEELKNYDWWGHFDLDMVLGNIRKFITDDILQTYDKVGRHGHFMLYKNIEDINKLFMKKHNGIVLYKEVFTSPLIFIFDESKSARLFFKDKKVYDIYNFVYNPLRTKRLKQSLNFNRGELSDGRKEYLYAHFMYRKFYGIFKNAEKDVFFIATNDNFLFWNLTGCKKILSRKIRKFLFLVFGLKIGVIYIYKKKISVLYK